MFYPFLRPLLFRLEPETAHELALGAIARTPPALLRFLSSSGERFPEAIRRFGLEFSNPVGLAAGFDKNGVAAPSLAALGFGFIELGTVTRQAQEGNPRPRIFRLPQDRALINRAGFNNDGAAALASRLARARPSCVVGINIGKSRVVPLEEATEDYLASLEIVHPHADYIAVNVSSPNTPGLRALQQADLLAALLEALQERNRQLSQARPKPLLVKIAPDLGDEDLAMIVSVVQRVGIAGIIATNTTTRRDLLVRTPRETLAAIGEGGLSGAPLKALSNSVIAKIHLLTRGAVPVIGVGGIFNAEDAWDKISAGASLVQVYTGLVYEGIGIVRRINRGLVEIMRREGFRSLDQAVGCRASEWSAFRACDHGQVN